MQASDVKSKYVGQSEKILHALFKYANICGPSLILIDEADQLFGKRTEDSPEHVKSLVCTLLQLMSECKKVLFVATTNRPEDFDTPFRRRFQAMIYVGLPNEKDRFKIISQSIEKVRHWITSTDIKWIAQMTENYSPADLCYLLIKANSICIEESRKAKFVVLKGNYFYPTYKYDRNKVKIQDAQELCERRGLRFRANHLKMDHILDALQLVKATFNPLELDQLLEFKDKYAPGNLYSIEDYMYEGNDIEISTSM